MWKYQYFNIFSPGRNYVWHTQYCWSKHVDESFRDVFLPTVMTNSDIALLTANSTVEMSDIRDALDPNRSWKATKNMPEDFTIPMTIVSSKVAPKSIIHDQPVSTGIALYCSLVFTMALTSMFGSFSNSKESISTTTYVAALCLRAFTWSLFHSDISCFDFPDSAIVLKYSNNSFTASKLNTSLFEFHKINMFFIALQIFMVSNSLFTFESKYLRCMIIDFCRFLHSYAIKICLFVFSLLRRDMIYVLAKEFKFIWILVDDILSRLLCVYKCSLFTDMKTVKVSSSRGKSFYDDCMRYRIKSTFRPWPATVITVNEKINGLLIFFFFFFFFFVVVFWGYSIISFNSANNWFAW